MTTNLSRTHARSKLAAVVCWERGARRLYSVHLSAIVASGTSPRGRGPAAHSDRSTNAIRERAAAVRLSGQCASAPPTAHVAPRRAENG